MTEKLKKQELLKKSFQFRKVYKEGTPIFGKKLSLWFIHNNSNFNRIGFSISKQKFKLSTHRNRVRRLLREAYRRNREKLKAGLDMVLGAKEMGKKVGYQEIEDELLTLCRRMKLLE